MSDSNTLGHFDEEATTNQEYSQNMTERQEFTVLRTYKDFEIREYLPCVLAEVKVSQHYSSATSIAFGSLFKYISKGNQGAQKIAMTAPVIAVNLTASYLAL